MEQHQYTFDFFNKLSENLNDYEEKKIPIDFPVTEPENKEIIIKQTSLQDEIV